MDIQNAQLDVDNWIKNHGVRYFNELTNMAQLTEEVHNDERKIAINRAAIATLVACIHDFEASVKLKK